MNDWEVTIKKADNGFIVSWKEEIEEGIFRNRFEVIEDDNSTYYQQKYKTPDIDKITMARVTEFITDHFGIRIDKFGKNNLNITYDGIGHKVE